MSKGKSLEAERILENLPLEVLQGLAKIYSDKKSYEAIRSLLTFLLQIEQEKIVRNASSAVSMDSLIKINTDQSFSRGRISLTILQNAIIKEAGVFADKKMEKAKDGQ